MYVDESGVEQLKDQTTYYIVSGTIFHEDTLDTMKRIIQDYKDRKFIGDLKDAEIHLHDMYSCQNDFDGLTVMEKWDLINELYHVMNNIQMTSISVCVDKPRFKNAYGTNHKKVIEWGYTILTERFQMFLQDEDSKGVIRIDRTTDNEHYKLNAKDTNIIDHINKVRRENSSRVRAVNVIEEPLMLDSATRKGLQVADAVAYCTTKFMNNKTEFNHSWNIVYNKLRKNPTTNLPQGYGLIIFPKR